MENRGWVSGRWIERAGERRRCYYRLTDEGRRVLAEQQERWQEFIAAVGLVMEGSHA
jgi:DNA-binding PadR family transcriptional regulator